MSAPLPDALRAWFQMLIEEGLSARGGIAAEGVACHRGALGSSDPPHRAFFAEVIAQDGDITMPELASALHDATGVRAHPNAIGKFLRKLGYTHKRSRWLPPNAAVPR